MAVFSFRDGRMILEEVAEDTTVEAVRAATEAKFETAEIVGVF